MSGGGLPAPDFDVEVVQLLGADGQGVGFVAGSPEQTASLANGRWISVGPVRTAVECLRTAVARRVRDARAEAERRGVLVDGNTFDLDAHSLSQLALALQIAVRNPEISTVVPTREGFVLMTANALFNASVRVRSYLHSLAEWERATLEHVSVSGSVDDLETVRFDTVPQGSGGFQVEEYDRMEDSALVAATISANTLDLSEDAVIAGMLRCGPIEASRLDVGDIVGAAATVASLDAGDGPITTTGPLAAGTTTLGQTTAGALAAASAAVQGTLDVTGASTLGDVRAGATTVASMDAGAGPISTTGTLVAGSTTLGETTTGPLTAASVAVQDTLAVSGATTMDGKVGIRKNDVSARSETLQVTGGVYADGGLTIEGTTAIEAVSC